MTLNQSIAIITDLKRKQLLMSQLVDHSHYYIFRAGPHYLGMDVCPNSSVCHFVSMAVEGRVREQ
ncbi:hypothetical protein NST74_24100 [Paenibacillus sp. FSL F4-0125]|uniref:hypothetical protein n=1 Tax=Paenibacillus sp. FSL F4-0125 TaxID=2954730 RepID=UPI0030FA7329